MTWHRTELEVDAMIEDMINRSKSKYITQGVTFNKTCPRQLGLLRNALMSSTSFSGLVKEMFAIKFNEEDTQSHHIPKSTTKIKNMGNFI
jgi:hypothetical protein